MFTFKKPSEYCNAELAILSEECDLYDDTDLADRFHSWRYTQLANHSLFVGILKRGEAVFYVDGYCDRFDVMSVVTGARICRWLMYAWVDLIGDIDLSQTIWCTPWGDDGLLERRVLVFQKLGFEFLESHPEPDQMVFTRQPCLRSSS